MANWPVHSSPKGEHAAKAPYNFVPLPSNVVTIDPRDLPDQDRYDPERYSGRLQCRLMAASPLYVRAALEWQEFEQSLASDGKKEAEGADNLRNKPDFFYTADAGRPVIPGSSLRGMLRTLVEIVSYSKVQWVTNRKPIYRAVGDTTSHGEAYRERLMRLDGTREHSYTPLMQAGYMQELPNGDWCIRPAKSINGTTFARIAERAIPPGLTGWKTCKNASKIWVQVGPYDYQQVRGGFIRVKYARVLRAAATPQPGMEEARLAVSGWMANKRSEAVIFDVDYQATMIPVDQDLVRKYRDQYQEIYTQQRTRGGAKTSLLGPEGVFRNWQPIFYLMENGKLVFISHCMMLRIPYPQSPLNMVPEPLRKESDLDLGEAIFGYSKSAGSGKERAYAGRLFVSDALLDGDPADVWLNDGKPVIPRILGSPKPTTFQHYLTQQHPDPVSTGGRFTDGRPRTQMALSDYACPSPEETVVRGHKLYWHKGEVGIQEIEEEPTRAVLDSQHTQIRPVRAGTAFTFEIRFENLSEVELGALLWVLDRAADEAYRLNLGMGKPLGMGAIQIESALHLEDRQARYSDLFAGDGWATGITEPGSLRSRAADAFEAFVMARVGERGLRRLAELERIQSLLALLSWPGPDPAETRYLEIEHPDREAKRGKVNEYKDRPVLPAATALKVRTRARRRSEETPEAAPLPAGYQRGTVKAFGLGPSQSFGFIFPEEGGAEVFVHRSQLAEGVTTLEPGQKVVFRTGRGMKGPQAMDVRPIS